MTNGLTILPKGRINTTGRAAILAFEEELKRRPDAIIGDQSDMLEHTFCTGVYARDLVIPANTDLTGKIHFHDHFVFLMEGEIIVVTEDGEKHHKAPEYFVSPAGVKRAARTITDTIWVTIHANPKNEKDLKKLEAMNIAKSFDEYDSHAAKLEYKKKFGFKKIFATIKKYLPCHLQQ